MNRKFLYLLIFVFTLSSLSAEEKKEMPSLKIGGQIFMDYYYVIGQDTSVTSGTNKGGLPALASDMSGVTFRRIDLWADYDLSKNVTTRLRFETEDTRLVTSKNIMGFFVKDAFIKFKDVLPGQDIVAGLQPTFPFEISEAAWGYRSVEKTQMDLRSIVPTRDMGLSIRGRIDAEGMFNYAVMYGNGSGLAPESDRYKRIYGIFSVKPVKDLQTFIYADYSYQKDTTIAKSKLDRNVLSAAFFATYKIDNLINVGVEALYNTTANSYINKDTARVSKNAFLLSAYCNVTILDNLIGLVRFDTYDPNIDANSLNDSRKFIVLGFNWKVDKTINVIPNIEMELFEKSGIKSTNIARITLAYNY